MTSSFIQKDWWESLSNLLYPFFLLRWVCFCRHSILSFWRWRQNNLQRFVSNYYIVVCFSLFQNYEIKIKNQVAYPGKKFAGHGVSYTSLLRSIYLTNETLDFQVSFQDPSLCKIKTRFKPKLTLSSYSISHWKCEPRAI